MRKKTKQTDGRARRRHAARGSVAAREMALKVSNDIAESIDCGESRKTLRAVISWWADKAADEAQRRSSAESQIEIFKAAKGLMDAALPPNSVISNTKPD